MSNYQNSLLQGVVNSAVWHLVRLHILLKDMSSTSFHNALQISEICYYMSIYIYI